MSMSLRTASFIITMLTITMFTVPNVQAEENDYKFYISPSAAHLSFNRDFGNDNLSTLMDEAFDDSLTAIVYSVGLNSGKHWSFEAGYIAFKGGRNTSLTLDVDEFSLFGSELGGFSLPVAAKVEGSIKGYYFDVIHLGPSWGKTSLVLGVGAMDAEIKMKATVQVDGVSLTYRDSDSGMAMRATYGIHYQATDKIGVRLVSTQHTDSTEFQTIELSVFIGFD